MTENAPFFVDNEQITLTRRGLWIADGVEITHEPTQRLFARNLHRDNDGYFIQVGRETKRISVEDTPYFVVRIEGQNLLLNDGSVEPLKPERLRFERDRLVVELRRQDSQGRPFHAAFLSAPNMELLRELEEEPGSYYLKIQGKKVILSRK